jgi:hypothetical protein
MLSPGMWGFGWHYSVFSPPFSNSPGNMTIWASQSYFSNKRMYLPDFQDI